MLWFLMMESNYFRVLSKLIASKTIACFTEAVITLLSRESIQILRDNFLTEVEEYASAFKQKDIEV